MAIISPVTLEFKALGPDRTITWPATPKITQGIQVNYQTWELQHTNYQPSAFGNRATPEITVSGPWFSRDADEAKETLKAIHTLRTATMMYYGRNDSKRGTPPPVGRFSAHGLYNSTPVVVKTFQYDFPNDVDYVTAGGPTLDPVIGLKSLRALARPLLDPGEAGGPVNTSPPDSGGGVDQQAVPVLFEMSVTLIVQMNPIEVVKTFELDKFLSGELLGQGYI